MDMRVLEQNNGYNCELSELSGLFNARIFYIYICLYISGRTSCRNVRRAVNVLNVCNIRPVRYSTRIESGDKPVFNS